MPFDNTYSRLPERFYERITPVRVKNPGLIRVNRELAASMEFPLPETDSAMAELFSGNELPEGCDPVALVYAGHQFGHFVPRLGDGRAVLLGEYVNSTGKRFDIQLKGSGRTRFSRNGDGLSPLGPVIREYIISEAMYRLGIPTTRALAMVSTGEKVFREEELPGAVLTRVAASHIRVGTFEYFASRSDHEALKILTDYAIERHYPELTETAEPYAALLDKVCAAQAALVARWMSVGFIHGVMNTDNTTVSGETIDYGPCAFMDSYDPSTVFSSIDTYGRYAFGRQPAIAQWNMASFAGCLLPLLHENEDTAREAAQSIIDGFKDIFKQHYFADMCRKIGFSSHEDISIELLNRLLEIMQQGKSDFTLTFRKLSSAVENTPETFLSGFSGKDEVGKWLIDWRKELNRQGIAPDKAAQIMNGCNPAVIARNHRVEQAISAAVEHGDYSVTDRLLEAIRLPYAERTDFDEYRNPPEPSEKVYRTFCGT
ncbi:protein adenylyltransferase SelO [Maridesulfovibrio sp. FT414]|uniref:protein adenylyltransferase SelO n=1 Tax=Maridesulfovibrio sp. FT414 TaxID=2979469 RepID=UPI003D8028BC